MHATVEKVAAALGGGEDFGLPFVEMERSTTVTLQQGRNGVAPRTQMARRRDAKA